MKTFESQQKNAESNQSEGIMKSVCKSQVYLPIKSFVTSESAWKESPAHDNEFLLTPYTAKLSSIWEQARASLACVKSLSSQTKSIHVIVLLDLHCFGMNFPN